jgi:hypothetical protein
VLGPSAVLVATRGAAESNGLFRCRWFYIGSAAPSAVLFDQSSSACGQTIASSTGDNRFILSVREDTVDLNSDGDMNDTIGHLIGPAGVVNLGVTTQPPVPDYLKEGRALSYGGPIAFTAAEIDTDLNGDGDMVDDVLHIYDGEVRNVGVAASARQANSIQYEPGERPGELIVGIPEPVNGRDLNADGDQWDTLPYVIRKVQTVGSIQPARLLDTRSSVGYSGAKPAAGQVVTLQVAGRGGIPTTGVAAVALNITVTDATDAGFVTVWGGGAQPGTSNLNVARRGQTIPNLVLAPVATDGTVRIFTSAGAHLIADAITWFGATGAYKPINPDRALDTRNGAVGYSGPKPAAGGIVEVQVVGRSGISALPGQLVVANVTAVDATAPGYLTVWGSGSQPATSNVNIQSVGQTIPNLVVVPIGADGKIRIYTSNGTHLLADIFGTLSGPDVSSSSPDRILDTRPAAQIGYRGPTPAAGQTVALSVGSPGEIQIVNVTARTSRHPASSRCGPTGRGRTLPTSIPNRQASRSRTWSSLRSVATERFASSRVPAPTSSPTRSAAFGHSKSQRVGSSDGRADLPRG